VPGEAFGARERGGRRRERSFRRRVGHPGGTSQTLGRKKACQLTSRLASHPRRQPFHKTGSTLSHFRSPAQRPTAGRRDQPIAGASMKRPTRKHRVGLSAKANAHDDYTALRSGFKHRTNSMNSAACRSIRPTSSASTIRCASSNFTSSTSRIKTRWGKMKALR